MGDSRPHSLGLRFSGLIAAALLMAGLCGCDGCHRSPSGIASIDDSTGKDVIERSIPNALASRPAELLLPGRSNMMEEFQSRLDPNRDGWESEAFHDAAAAQLRRLIQPRGEPRLLDSPLADDAFACPSLRPKTDQVKMADSRVRLFRATGNRVDEAPVFHGAVGLQHAWAALTSPLGASPRASHKIFRVDVEASQAVTHSHYQASGRRGTLSIQQSATWRCRWTLPADKSPPKLLSIFVADYEEAEIENSQTAAWFTDATLDVLGRDRSFAEQLRYGINHWLPRIETRLGMSNYVRCGMAIGDVNGDGRDDVYVCQPGGLPNRLLVQNADGTATDCAHSAGLDWLDHTASALFVDWDNDGDQDLAAAMPGHVLLLANDGGGRFTAKADLECDQDVHSLTAADYDNDGDLDLFLCVDFAAADQQRRLDPFVYHDAQDGGANALFRNETAIRNESVGNHVDGKEPRWRFTDVTAETGLGEANHRHSLAASWEDFDNDGDADLYVANDHGPNNLFRNEGGRFVDIASAAGVQDFGSGMSVCWGDYNRDGWMDLYIGNMYSFAGSRITRQAMFKPSAGDQTRAVYRRFAKGNTLLKNADGQAFTETGAAAGVEMGRWAWSSIFLDVNNDGWEDIFVANGNITKEDTGDL